MTAAVIVVREMNIVVIVIAVTAAVTGHAHDQAPGIDTDHPNHGGGRGLNITHDCPDIGSLLHNDLIAFSDYCPKTCVNKLIRK